MRTKKIYALLLACVMVCSLTVPIFAVQSPQEEDASFSIDSIILEEEIIELPVVQSYSAESSENSGAAFEIVSFEVLEEGVLDPSKAALEVPSEDNLNSSNDLTEELKEDTLDSSIGYNGDDTSLTINSAAALPADLFVFDVYLPTGTAEPFPINTLIPIRFSVGNAGETTANNILVGFYINGTYLGGMTLSTLPANAYQLCEVSLQTTAAGAHTVKIFVNPNQTVPESNYNNNSVTKTYVWGPASSYIDPAAYLIEGSLGDSFGFNEQVFIYAYVANLGTVTAKDIPIRITITDATGYVMTFSDITGGIPPNSAIRWSLGGSFRNPGNVIVKLEVDPGGTITDKNRQNNILSKTFKVTADPTEWYSSLGFQWPVPGYNQRFGGYPGHAGMDVNARRGAPIRSMYAGTVKLVGGSTTNSGGFLVVIDHGVPDALNPTNPKNPIIARYLHMHIPALVSTGAQVYSGQHIGYVGRWGYAYRTPQEIEDGVDTRVFHLHVDFNSKGIIGSAVSLEQAIDWSYFFPNVSVNNTPYALDDYHGDFASIDPYPVDDDGYLPQSGGGSSAFSAPIGDIEIDEADLLENGYFVDNALINYVGLAAYDEWLRLPSDHTKTVYEMLEYFEITDEVLKGILHESVYDWYAEFKPN